MNIICVYEEPREISNARIFLAGPTAKSEASASAFDRGRERWVGTDGEDLDLTSWRAEALRLLVRFGFQGQVLVPEWRNGKSQGEEEQYEWEHKMLDYADCVAFWVPRNMNTLPGLVTNIEFGMLLERDGSKVAFGAPCNAEHVKYMHWMARKKIFPECSCETLDGLVHRAIVRAEDRSLNRSSKVQF